jgi:hypothetical protein
VTVSASLGFVLRAAVAALLPPRLVWGAMVFLVLVVAGRAADALYLAFGNRPISPSGLAVGAWTAEQERIARRSAGSAAVTFAQGSSLTREGPLNLAEADASEMRRVLDAAYFERLAALEAGNPTMREGDRVGFESRYRQARAAVDGLHARGPFEALGADLAMGLRRMGAAALALSPFGVLDAGIETFVRVPAALVRAAPWFAFLAGLPIAVLFSVLVGGLARMAVCDAGRGVRPTIADAAAFVRRALLRFAGVPVYPIALVALSVLLMAGLGVLLRVPALDMIAGLLYGAALLLSFLVVIVGGAFAFGWPLAIASVATGDSDSVDALVRSTSYLLRRPGIAIVTIAVAMAAIAIGIGLVGFLTWLATSLAEAAIGWGAGKDTAAVALGDVGVLGPNAAMPPIAGRTARVAGGFIDLWELILRCLVGGAAVSLIIDAGARAYLALRFRCDGQDPSAVRDVEIVLATTAPTE